MRALFLIPPAGYNPHNTPVDRVYGCNYGFDYKQPIHLLALATYARDIIGWDVRLLDCPAEDIDVKRFESMVRREHYDVVIQWTTYLSAIEDLTAARFIHDHMPGPYKQLFVGTASTWRPEEFTVSHDTFCILGEPEHTLLALSKAWSRNADLEGMAGVAWWKEGQIRRGGFRAQLDVSELPMPDRRLLRGTEYRANRLSSGRSTVMVVSRGCGFRCNFCTPNAVDQANELEFKRLQPEWYVDRPPLRKRTIDQIVEEFEEIASLGYTDIEIADNIFTWGARRTIEICERIAHLKLRWICLARANMLHDDLVLTAMKDAGCQLIYMGSESFDDGILDDMSKKMKVADVYKAVDACHRNGIEPEVSVLVGGSPAESWKTIWNSWRAARSLNTRFVHFSVALPAPSTELYDIAMRDGWFVDGDFVPTDNARDVIINLPNLSAGELRMALKLAYAGQYLSPRSLLGQLAQVRSLRDVRHKAKAGLKLFGYLGERKDRARNGAVGPGRVTPLSMHRTLPPTDASPSEHATS